MPYHRAHVAVIAALIVLLFPDPAGAHAQTRAATRDTIPVPQEGAINTSRSNLKNAGSRTTRQTFVPLTIDLSGESGTGTAVSRTVTTNDLGEFSFGTLPAGRYVLTVREVGAPDGQGARTAAGTPGAQPDTLAGVSVTIQGVMGGTIERVLARDGSGAASAGAPPEARRQGGRPGRPTYGNITFWADGRSEVKGAAHDISKSVIQNIRADVGGRSGSVRGAGRARG